MTMCFFFNFSIGKYQEKFLEGKLEESKLYDLVLQLNLNNIRDSPKARFLLLFLS